MERKFSEYSSDIGADAPVRLVIATSVLDCVGLGYAADVLKSWL